jgi:hypothetical protein
MNNKMYNYNVRGYSSNILDKVIPQSWYNIQIENKLLGETACNSLERLEGKGIDVNFIYHIVKKEFQKLWINPKDLIQIGNVFLEYLWGKENGKTIEDWDNRDISLIRYCYFNKHSEFYDSDNIQRLLNLFEHWG